MNEAQYALNAIDVLQQYITATDGISDDVWMLQDWLDTNKTDALVSEDANVIRNVLTTLDHLVICLAESKAAYIRTNAALQDLRRTTATEIMRLRSLNA